MKTLIFLLFSCWIPCCSQSLQELHSFADHQLEIKNFDEAEYAYQRIAFFDTGTFRSQVYQSLGNLHFQKKDYYQAGIYYDLAYTTVQKDSIKTQLLLKKSFAWLLLEKPHNALIELYSIDDSIYKRKTNFYFALAYFQIEDWKLSGNYFKKAFHDDPIKTMAIESLFKNHLAKKKKSASKAKALSIVIPGLGQLYAGDYKNAFYSALLTGGLGLLFIHTGLNYSYLDAILSVFPWLHRYYLGGVKKAGLIAGEKEKQRKEELYLKLLSVTAIPD